jgi:hypothetical protein
VTRKKQIIRCIPSWTGYKTQGHELKKVSDRIHRPRLYSRPHHARRKGKSKSPATRGSSRFPSYHAIPKIRSFQLRSRHMSSPQIAIDLRGSQGLPKLPYTLRTRKLSIAIHWAALCSVTSILPITFYFVVKFAAHAEIDTGKDSAAPGPVWFADNVLTTIQSLQSQQQS